MPCLFLPTFFVMLLFGMPSLVLGNWCAYGVDESKTPPTTFADVVKHEDNHKCMRLCKTIADLPSGGTDICTWASAISGGIQKCVFTKDGDMFTLAGVCPGKSGKPYNVNDEEPKPDPKPDSSETKPKDPEPVAPAPNPDPEPTDGSFGEVKAMPICLFLVLFGIQALIIRVVGGWHFLLG